MLTDNELTRLADMAAALRPDWHARSVRAYLAKSAHARRAYADVALALCAVAVDPKADTPARLDQHGPWWALHRALTGSDVPDVGPGRGVQRCTKVGHEHEPATACRWCRSEAIAIPDERYDLTSIESERVTSRSELRTRARLAAGQ
ncbi:hypothetical protein [Mycobacterium sp.]|uniref:hypothetical protein n=1 Tax=Mycobacterium sp. TaxID=1785 RepID=UPI002D07C622|nr:hypothetical protein [Mycobacterium sp.]HTY35380.1 hypothetical protein [Mycobacterium sp.]